VSFGGAIVWRRLYALCRKEGYQIVRDPSSIVIAFALPLVLLLIFGYGVNLDAARVRIGLLNEDSGADSARFVATLEASRYLDPRIGGTRATLDRWLLEGRVRGLVILQSDFSARLARPGQTAPIEVVTDGGEPNTANFVAAYVQGAWTGWQQQRAQDRGLAAASAIALTPRFWFNPAAISTHFIVPGSIAIIMTIIGALLTSMVVAREWERGTMEALLSTPVTRSEFLLSKIIPYYILGILSMVLCVAMAVWQFGVPFRGSLALLFLLTSLFLGSSLGLGLLLSTITRNQFNAAQAALNAAFLPANMLSGYVYEISSMPPLIQAVTYLIPARYFVSSLQTLFQTGFVARIIVTDGVFLVVSAAFFLGLTAWKTRRRLD
jgi:ABC-2 type transport system permease protein